MLRYKYCFPRLLQVDVPGYKCRVYVNGLNRGLSGGLVSKLPLGKNFVRVMCPIAPHKAVMSDVYTVEIPMQGSTVRLPIDLGFDLAYWTDSNTGVGLFFSDRNQRAKFARPYVKKIASVGPLRFVWMLDLYSDKQAMLYRLDAKTGTLLGGGAIVIHDNKTYPDAANVKTVQMLLRDVKVKPDQVRPLGGGR